MAIEKLKKLTVAASHENKNTVVAELQRFGCLHIIDSEPSQTNTSLNTNISLNTGDLEKKYQEAIQFLHNTVATLPQLRTLSSVTIETILDDIITLKADLKHKNDQLDVINQQIKLIEPWGNFALPESEFDQYFTLWFYRFPVKNQRQLNELEYPWQMVNKTHKYYYVVVISEDQKTPNIDKAHRDDLGSLSLSELNNQKEKITLEIEECNLKRIALSKYAFVLKSKVAEIQNRNQFARALASIQDESGFFVLKAWIPVKKLAELKLLSDKVGFAFIAESPSDNDTPPTLLAPQSFFSAGAILSAIYQTPNYNRWDPSIHLYLSFSVFFAIILSDVGYALVLSILFLAIGFIYRKNSIVKQFDSLMFSIFLASSIWGLMVGSFFGYEMSAISTVIDLKIIDLNNYNWMMKISVGIGVIHIVLANITSAVSSLTNSEKFSLNLLSKLGWCLVATGGYCYWLFMNQTEFLTSLSWLMAAGFALIFVFSEPLKSFRGKYIKKSLISGFVALSNLTKLFGDALSYMRLFALGLASASLAITFNNLSAQFFNEAGIGYIFGAIIFIIGHLVNIVLGVMSGVVHGLRLNFIEFYNWSDPGEGYVFKPFYLKEIDYE